MVGPQERLYHVEGRWPFPSDMLRRDSARSATPRDAELIKRMTREVSDEEIGMETIKISLIMYSGPPAAGRTLGRFLPDAKRWESFDWRVVGDPDVDQERALTERLDRDERLRAAALAKLTDEERHVLGL